MHKLDSNLQCEIYATVVKFLFVLFKFLCCKMISIRNEQYQNEILC